MSTTAIIDVSAFATPVVTAIVTLVVAVVRTDGFQKFIEVIPDRFDNLESMPSVYDKAIAHPFTSHEAKMSRAIAAEDTETAAREAMQIAGVKSDAILRFATGYEGSDLAPETTVPDNPSDSGATRNGLDGDGLRGPSINDDNDHDAPSPGPSSGSSSGATRTGANGEGSLSHFCGCSSHWHRQVSDPGCGSMKGLLLQFRFPSFAFLPKRLRRFSGQSCGLPYGPISLFFLSESVPDRRKIHLFAFVR
ncbi:MAG: hypothetical protein JKY94_13670 [Rhodobacteraceae bacterium]|nr:hypothetical protein [Paracoccaceae bacterium]